MDEFFLTILILFDSLLIPVILLEQKMKRNFLVGKFRGMMCTHLYSKFVPWMRCGKSR